MGLEKTEYRDKFNNESARNAIERFLPDPLTQMLTKAPVGARDSSRQVFKNSKMATMIIMGFRERLSAQFFRLDFCKYYMYVCFVVLI